MVINCEELYVERYVTRMTSDINKNTNVYGLKLICLMCSNTWAFSRLRIVIFSDNLLRQPEIYMK